MKTAVFRFSAFVAIVAIAMLMVTPALADRTEDAGGLSRFSPTRATFDLREQGLAALWRQDVVKQAGKPLRALYCGGTYLVAESTENQIFCIHAVNGTWDGGTVLRKPLALAPVGLPGDEILLVIGSTFYRFDVKTGEIGTTWRPSVAAYTTPLVDGASVIVGEGSGLVMSLDLADGERQWACSVRGAILGQPVLSRGVLYVTSFGDRLVAVDANDGSQEWTWQPNEPAKISSAAEVKGGRVYAGDTGGHVYALDADNGKVLWRVLAGACIVDRPRIADGKLLALTNAPALACFDTADAPAPAWTYEGATRIVLVGKKAVYVLTADNRIAALDLPTGNELWKERLPKDATVVDDPARPAFYVADKDGTIVAFTETD